MSTRTLALLWLVVSQAICALSLVPWIFLLSVAMLALHTPTLDDWLALVAVLGYPPLMLACAIAAWVLYRRNRLRGAIVLPQLGHGDKVVSPWVISIPVCVPMYPYKFSPSENDLLNLYLPCNLPDESPSFTCIYKKVIGLIALAIVRGLLRADLRSDGAS